MTNLFSLKLFRAIAFFLTIIISINSQNASEILIYADNISYDKDDNLIAKGKAKIIYENEILISEHIIYDKKKELIILPKEFSFKDNKNNYYYGSEGSFSKNLKKANIVNVKMIFNDGSRIVGKEAKRDGAIDIISKTLQKVIKDLIV